MPTNDELIKSNVFDELQWDNRLDSSEIKIVVDNGSVVLSGYVPNFTAKNAALTDARGIPGVLGVEDELEMRQPDEVTIPKDEDIQEAIQKKFEDSADLFSQKLEASSDNGWVTLEGTVDAYWKKEQAESDVYRVKGVLGVKNSIAVAASGEIEDEEIAKEIVNALKRNREIEPDNIEVVVENNHVTLSGTIKSDDARSQIKKAAMFTDNVKALKDNLIIKYPER